MGGTIILCKVGSTIAETIAEVGDYEAWFQRAVPDEVLGVVDLCKKEVVFPGRIAGLIVMGSPVSVYDDLPWYESACGHLGELIARDVPTLGVCFGHQMIAQLLGGAVAPAAAGFEAGTVAIQRSSEGARDSLFGTCPDSVLVNQSHRDSVCRLPAGAVVLASNAHDAHQAVRYRERAWSVQFHPEMSRREVVCAIRGHREKLEREQQCVRSLEERARDTPYGWELLRRFVALCRENKTHG